MSRSHELVTLLHREKNLVPDIFSILTVSTASEAIKCYVLKFIENLLNLDKELDDDDTAVKSILLPNLEALICSLHCLFQHDNASKRKSHKYLGGNEVRIFKLLSKYIKDPLQARTFIDILLPFLAKRVEDSDACPQALEVIQDMIPTLGIESTAKILNAVSPLLVTVSPDVRFCICDLLDTLAKVDSSVLSVAKLIRELNSTSKMEVDGLDDDAIINTYERIDVQFFITIGEEHTSVILSQCVFDMSSEELVLRQSAYSIVLSFIEFCVLMLGQENGRQYESGEMGTFDGNRWTRACILRLINKCLLKHIGDAMSQGNSVKKEWIDILRDMVLKLPDDANFSSFKALCSDDAEIDFFYNIVHLQKHRRARALLRFKNIISKTKLPEGIVKNVFAPLFFSMLLDLKDGKDEHVRAACMEALASVCVHMEWKSYYALLSRCFREMRKNANKQKVLVRLVCAVLDQFHFSQPVSSQAGEEFLVGVSADNMNEIRSCLHKTLLPKIQKLMTSDTDSINVNISLAAVKILKLLPGNIMDTQLPTVTNKICNSLKSRSENIRDEARTALAACLKELGLEYLQYVVKVLRATLKRGYELHVLGYTLYFILSKYLMNHSGGSLDYCLEDLISVVENDILGEVAEEKEVEKIASKMKETKKCKSFESLKLIAQNITFKSHALKLLTPVKAHLQKHLTPKVKTKLESMLDHIAAGIELNPSVEQTDLFTFIYGLLEDGIKEENVLAENSLISGSEKDQANKKTIPKARVIITRSVGSHLITVFALALLHNRVKNAKLDKNDIWLLSMLDPFIKPLGNCLSSQYENILSLSLRCLSLLVRLPLPSLASLGDKIKVTLLDIAQSSINSSSPLMQSCLKLLTVLLQSTKITLSSDQLHLLIQFPIFDDLEKNTSFVALSLLKAIVKRKLVVHEIYDLMTRVAELMVTSQVESIRKKCSQILLQFLLDYRLSRKRLEEHLSTLLANLRYEHSSGRETVLEMLCAIVMKFPKSIIDEHSLTFFIHLVFCLVNDRDTKVRSMIGATIKLLTGRISSHSLNSILDYVLPLYSFEQHKEKPQLCGAAAQVLGLLIEVMRGNFQRHVDPILVVVGWILHSAVDVGLHQEQDCSDEVTLPFWNDAYYSLVMLEKLLYQFRDLCFKRELEGIWEEISKLLLHPHLWLCNRSNRLLALYFTTVTEVIRENAENSFGTFVLLKPAKIFMIVISLCCQLKAQVTDDDVVNNLLTQNIAFAISSLPSSMQQNGSVEPHKLWSALEQHEQAQLLKAFQSLDPGKGRGIFLALISGMYGQNDNEQFKDPQNFLISYLLKRMGKLSLEMGAIQMKIVFNIFKTLSLQLSPDNCHIYAFQMLLPVYKVSEGFAGKVVSDDLKQLAQEVRESIRNTLGIQTFVQIYQEIRKSLKAKRDKRKHEEKVMAVVNPMRNAKRKLRIAAKHCANKKRKIMTMKMARWMH
ncbi:U3 small nucleolar RNA-associated protein 20 [Carica papaya]|uniref:U3 small nucleolar RNA-associated protein 20 n=1 Tax=Carica papaya TaxID=3649 RepID=UPI000B8C7F2B|nr:U3 small nucleolar RNA-associated protein 20 [Carica papaya]XP_021894299.1 U3 small nucleolar RNA-associated protein 20 [Carica papaya]XP_021894300.1 U3 small nucleolar RNA-associated protein 20 [Carica papaya]